MSLDQKNKKKNYFLGRNIKIAKIKNMTVNPIKIKNSFRKLSNPNPLIIIALDISIEYVIGMALATHCRTSGND